MKKILILYLISVLTLYLACAIKIRNVFAYYDPITITSTLTDEVVEEDKIIFDNLKKFTVKIFMTNPSLSLCSGVVVNITDSQTEILTCKHCIAPIEETYVEDKKVDLIVTSAQDDLALLIVNKRLEDKESIKIKYWNEGINNKIYHIGYPGITKEFFSVGKIIRYSEDWGWANLDSTQGCSGGGIFNEKKELIGILWGGLENGGENISIFESAEDIQNFLEKIKNYQKISG